MTLEFLLNELCDLGIRHNLVNYAAAGGSVYFLNSETIQDYPYFFFSPTEDIRIEKNFTTYGISVFYVDRLIGDNMNDTQVYSNGTLAIQNLMRQVKAMDGVVGVDDYNIRVFSETEKMADKVNGAYARVNITTLNSYNCSIYFDETGAPMGTYIPDVIKDTSVLDALASKEWVNRLIASLSVSGITPEEFERIMGNYVLENKFATINGEKITNRKKFTLVDQSAYTQDLQNIYQAISGATPEDYSAMQEQVSANTENISTLSALTENVVSSVTEQREIIEQLQETDSHIYILNSRSTQADIDAAVDAALNSGDTEFAKIVLYYLDRNQYIPLKPYYKYRPWADYDVYYTGCFPIDNGNMRMVLLGLTRGSMEVGYREQDFNFGLFVSRSQLPTINGSDLYRGGSFSLVENTNGGVTGIWSGTQAAYDAIEEKSSTTLYVING